MSLKHLIAKDKQNIWHPFTQMADWLKDDPCKPLIIEKAKGNYLYDTNSNKYIDGVSSLWVNNLGHQNPKIDKAIKNQLSKVAHTTFLGLTHKPAIELSEKLLKILPKHFKKIFYSDNGSTAVEVALKMAYQYWQFKGENKSSFLSFKNAYHGDTVGAVSVGGTDLFHKRFKALLFKAHFAPSPFCKECPRKKISNLPFFVKAKTFKEHCKIVDCKGECLKEAEKLLKQNTKTLAAAIIEPEIQAASGMIIMPAGFVKEFATLCKKYGVLLICDEVATGFGRTGKMFAIELSGIKPDFICLSKGITGGYLPLAVTATTNEIYNAFLGKYEEFKTFFHGHSYTANPLACAAANAVIDIFKKDKILKKLTPTIKFLRNELANLAKHNKVETIRHLGVMAAIDIISVDQKIGATICANMRKDGIIIRNLSKSLILFLPLTITKAEIKKIISSIRKNLNTL